VSPLPIHMNLNLVKIRSLNTVQPKDNHYREVVGQHKYGAEVELYCQVIIDKFDNRMYTWTGNSGETTGHLCFAQSYLDTIGVTLKRGDRITGIRKWNGTWTTYDLEITQVTPRGNLPAPLLLFAYFNERHETRESL